MLISFDGFNVCFKKFFFGVEAASEYYVSKFMAIDSVLKWMIFDVTLKCVVFTSDLCFFMAIGESNSVFKVV